ncbi:MAG: hypothetical protein AAGF95_04295 [Chloroflexota bacterium]
MARENTHRLFSVFRRTPKTSEESIPLSVKLPSLWKAMIVTSFLMNIVLLFVLLLVVVFAFTWRSELNEVVVQGLARENIIELRDVVNDLQHAHIVTTIPIDEPLPVELNVPIDQTTMVTTTVDVPISAPAFIDMGPFGELYPNVNLNLPAGTPLLIELKLDVPLETTIPVELDVPVDIALEDTDLAPEFQRLGGIVDSLVAPVAPLLDIDMSETETAPEEDAPPSN